MSTCTPKSDSVSLSRVVKLDQPVEMYVHGFPAGMDRPCDLDSLDIAFDQLSSMTAHADLKDDRQKSTTSSHPPVSQDEDIREPPILGMRQGWCRAKGAAAAADCCYVRDKRHVSPHSHATNLPYAR